VRAGETQDNKKSGYTTMDFDQAFTGYEPPLLHPLPVEYSLSRSSNEWNFPSPGATPTNPSFGSNALHTPKTSTFPSHFQDAFSTPQMPAYATPQHSQYTTTTPVQRPSTSSDTLRSNYYAHVHPVTTQPMQPPAQTLYQHPVTSPMQPAGFQMGAEQPMMQAAFNLPQMQTPPPTRGTSAKKAQQSVQIAFGTPSTIASRRFATPQQAVMSMNPQPVHQQTPIHFPQLQFSPDMFHFANSGPASAPVMPQTQMLWAQMQSPEAVTQPSSLADPFAPVTSGGTPWPAPPPQQQMMAQTPMFDTPAMASFPIQPPHPRPASAVPSSGAYIASTVPAATSASLDPSLIYSSPIRPSTARYSPPETAATVQQPFVPKRKDSAVPSHQPNQAPRDSTSPLVPVPEITGSGLRRSNTTGTVRPRSAHPVLNSKDSLNRSNSITQISRTTSPLKRAGRTPLGSISEHTPKRASVILTVDENGMARTETIGGPAPESPTKSIRERYPGLFDSDTSEDESDNDIKHPSRSASFTLSKSDERRTKAARLDPPLENLEGLELRRSSSRASVKGVNPSRAAISAAAQLRRQSSLRRSSRTTPAKRNPSSSTSSLIDSAPMDMGAEQHHARPGAEHGMPYSSQMLDGSADWPNKTPVARKRNATLEAHNRRWSMLSFDQQYTPTQNIHVPGFRPANAPAATAPMLIRCICGVDSDRGQIMIPCSSCTQFQHADCIGIDGIRPPMHYTCFLCTRPA
jgi:hypothetical protein